VRADLEGAEDPVALDTVLLLVAGGATLEVLTRCLSVAQQPHRLGVMISPSEATLATEPALHVA
jgi:hypothetical protein